MLNVVWRVHLVSAGYHFQLSTFGLDHIPMRTAVVVVGNVGTGAGIKTSTGLRVVSREWRNGQNNGVTKIIGTKV